MAGPISSLSAEAVLDGVDVDECASLVEERLAKSIDPRGHTISLGAECSPEECGEAVVVASKPVPRKSRPCRFQAEPLMSADDILISV
ncbi:hypothetical protein [Lentzea flaviverrucosa]|uniref:hypothetical protein n=1 Tax=Lentzea flaviverrucosa TaxID=200379 RepID=UPI00116077B7|nr:hypothetical protein [Lentzea flaviverrucosa]